MSAHRVWSDLVDVFPAKVDPGDAGTIYADRFFNFVDLTTAAAETRTMAAADRPCFMVLRLATHVGDCVVGFEGAINQASDIQATFDTAGDLLVLVAMPNLGGWRLLVNDGCALA